MFTKKRRDSVIVSAVKLTTADKIVNERGEVLPISTVMKNPRGCPGNVHVYVQNRKPELCFYGGSRVEVLREGATDDQQ